MKYRIGKVQDPRDDDPTFDDWQSALSAAIGMSGEDTWVIAHALCYQMAVYT